MTASAYRDPAYTNGYEFTEGSGYTLPEYPYVRPPELDRPHTLRHPVVIVGGGITGLTLAASLAQLGVRAVLIDEDNTVGVKGASSRGICYTQKSLEIFQRLGIYERIAAKGIRWSVGRTFAGSDEVYSFDLRQQNQQQGNDGGYDAGGGKNRGAASAGTADNAIQAKIAIETAGYVSQSGVNIMV